MTRKQNSVPFKLIDITTEQFADFKENYVIQDSVYDIELKTNIKVDSHQKVVGMYTKFHFYQKSEIILILECACHFKIETGYWKSQVEESILTLKRELLTHFLVLTVGTCRGVLHVKKPNWLNNLILPAWNVSSVIEENVEINLARISEEEE